ERLLEFLGARAIPGVEEISERRYRRLYAGERVCEIEVAPAARGPALELVGRGAHASDVLAIRRRARRLFDLDADPKTVAAHLGTSPLLARSVAEHPGLRVPGAWDGFELAVRAVLGQQVSVARASTLAGALVRLAGKRVGQGSGPSY